MFISLVRLLIDLISRRPKKKIMERLPKPRHLRYTQILLSLFIFYCIWESSQYMSGLIAWSLLYAPLTWGLGCFMAVKILWFAQEIGEKAVNIFIAFAFIRLSVFPILSITNLQTQNITSILNKNETISFEKGVLEQELADMSFIDFSDNNHYFEIQKIQFFNIILPFLLLMRAIIDKWIAVQKEDMYNERKRKERIEKAKWDKLREELGDRYISYIFTNWR